MYYLPMKSRNEAIIIGSMNLGEADKIVTLFSRGRGLQKGLAGNAGKSFRRFGDGLDAFTHRGGFTCMTGTPRNCGFSIDFRKQCRNNRFT